MSYVILLITLFFLSLKGYCGKKTSTYVNSSRDSVFFNLLRFLICIVIGLIVVWRQDAQAYLSIDGRMVALCLFAGISNAAFVVGWMMAIERNPLVTVDVTLTLGSIIPAVLCAILFFEPILPQKLLGFGIIVLASVVLSGHHTGVGTKRSLGSIIVLVIAVAGDGFTAFCQQLYGRFASEYPKSVYHFYTYVFSSLALILCLGYLRLRSPEKRTTIPIRKPLPHIVIMALCLFAANYLQTVLSGDYAMPSQILYPAIKGGCLITVNLTAMLFFGEKPTKFSILGSLLALAGIVAINAL